VWESRVGYLFVVCVGGGGGGDGTAASRWGIPRSV